MCLQQTLFQAFNQKPVDIGTIEPEVQKCLKCL